MMKKSREKIKPFEKDFLMAAFHPLVILLLALTLEPALAQEEVTLREQPSLPQQKMSVTEGPYAGTPAIQGKQKTPGTVGHYSGTPVIQGKQKISGTVGPYSGTPVIQGQPLQAPRKKIVRIEGEYFINVDKVVRENARKVEHRADNLAAGRMATEKCKEMGYSRQLAFFFERQDNKIVLEDVFCAQAGENQGMARAAMMKARAERKALLHTEGKKMARSAKYTDFTGFKTTDLAGEGSGVSKPTATEAPTTTGTDGHQ